MTGLIYLLLMVIGVPWHWRLWAPDDRTLWWGLPAWLFVAFFASFLISLYTAWLLRRPWPGEAEYKEDLQP